MPLRIIAAHCSEYCTAIAASLGMGIITGISYILGTSTPATEHGVVLDAATQVQGSPYALIAMISTAVGATWIVASLVNGIRNDIKANSEAGKKAWRELGAKLEDFDRRLDTMNEKREVTEREIAVIHAHINDCPLHSKR